MSIDAIEHGIRAESEVRTWYTLRCDDSPSGFVRVSKTPPTGANAMTVTIKPLYGEPFTVNADLLQQAVKLALGDRPKDLQEVVNRQVSIRRRVDELQPGDRVEVLHHGKANRRRKATVAEPPGAYSVVLQMDAHSDEEPAHFLRYEAAKNEIVQIFDRESVA